MEFSTCTLSLGFSESSCTFFVDIIRLEQAQQLKICFMFRAAAIYYVLCVYISPPTDSFTDVAVYPPMTIKEEEDRVQFRLAAAESNLDTPTDEKDPSDFV